MVSLSKKNRAIVVLGMHRSGTSVLTRIISLLGARLPIHLMKTSIDNPSGYWESPLIARFNDKLLEKAGGAWNSDRKLIEGWNNFTDLTSIENEAFELLTAEFGDSKVIVLKDPRFALLLPFWKNIFNRAETDITVIHLLRDPLEVAASLRQRSTYHLEWASVIAPERSALLWLRYVFAAEKNTRNYKRFTIDFNQVMGDWRSELQKIIEYFRENLMVNPRIPYELIDDFIKPDYYRNRSHEISLNDNLTNAFYALNLLKSFLCSGISDETIQDYCDNWSHNFDNLINDYTDLRRDMNHLSPNDIYAKTILEKMSKILAAPVESD